MSTPPTNSSGNEQPRDAAYWAEQTSVFRVSHLPTGALALNVEGRQGLSPLQGFGQMWEKLYRVRLNGAPVSPAEVIKTWKEHFPQFWPKGNRFYTPLTGIAPGQVAIVRLAPGGLPLSTGVMVLYADDESFTLMTPQGHVFAGWITFSAYEGDDCTVAQAQILMRANDPLYCHLSGFLALLCHKTWRDWPAKRCQQIGFFHKMAWHFVSSIQTLPGALKWASFLAIHGA